jgi:hypothetical protein
MWKIYARPVVSSSFQVAFGTVILGKFSYKGPVASGRVCVVAIAEDTEIESIVALKIYKKQKPFQDEMRVMCLFQHPVGPVHHVNLA